VQGELLRQAILTVARDRTLSGQLETTARRELLKLAEDGNLDALHIGLQHRWAEFVDPAVQMTLDDVNHFELIPYWLGNYRPFPPEKTGRLADVIFRVPNAGYRNMLLSALQASPPGARRTAALMTLARCAGPGCGGRRCVPWRTDPTARRLTRCRGTCRSRTVR